MNIVNSRYRIVRESYSGVKFIKSYVVADLWDKDKKIALSIIDRDLVPEVIFDFLRDNFLQVSGMTHPLFFRSFGFNNVVSKNDEKAQIFYTYETDDSAMYLSEYIHGKDLSVILKIFVEICQAIHFANITNFLYAVPELNDFFVVEGSDGLGSIKVRDIFSLQVKESLNSSYFNHSYKHTVMKLEKLGLILLTLFGGYADYQDWSENIDSIRGFYAKQTLSSYDHKILDCLLKICINLILKTYSRVDLAFYQIFNEINDALGSFFHPDVDKAMSSICFRPKFVAFNDKLQEVLKLCSATNEFSIVRSFLVKGTIGIGKTRFLRELGFLLNVEGATTYEFDLAEKKGSVFWLAFLTMLFDDLFELNDRYDLLQILRELRSLEAGDIDSNSNERGRLIYVISSILWSIDSKYSATILLDNLHCADSFTLDVFLCVLKDSYFRSNLKFVFSIDIVSIPGSAVLKDFESAVSNSSDWSVIELSSFSELDTAELIKNVLYMSFLPITYSKELYKLTGGNPSFTIAIIKAALSTGYLWKNIADGFWYVNDIIYDVEKLLKISGKTLSGNSNYLNFIDSELLEVVSVFNNYVKLDFLIEMCSEIPKDRLIDQFNTLVKYGYLNQVSDDVYSTVNKILRAFLYSSIPHEKKLKLHECAIKLLSQETDLLSQTELVLHLELSSRKVDAVSVLLNVARNQVLENKYQDAVLNYEKMIVFLEDDQTNTDLLVEVLIEAGNIYTKVGNINAGKIIFERVKDLLTEITDESLLVRYYLGVGNIYIITTDSSNISKVIKILEDYNFCDDKKLSAEYQIFLIQSKIINGELGEAQEMIRVALQEAANDSELNYLKTHLYRLDGNILFYSREFEKSLLADTTAYDIAKSNNDIRGMLLASNNMANVYLSIFEEYDTAIKRYDEVVLLSQNSGLVNIEIAALLNLSNLYLNLGNLKLAELHSIKALDKIYSMNMEMTGQHIYISLIMYNILCSKLQFIEADKYYDVFLRAKENDLISNSMLLNFYIEKSIVLFNIGMYDEVEKLLNVAKEYIHENDVKNILLDFRFTLNKIMKEKKYSFNTLIECIMKADDFHNRYYINEFIVYSFEFILQMIVINQFDEVKPFAEFILEFCGDNFRHHIVNQVGINLVLANLDSKKKEFYLLESLKLVQNKDCTYFEIIINIQLGLYYINSGKIALGILKCLAAELLILGIMSGIPYEYKLKVFNFNCYKVPFKIIHNFLSKKDNIITNDVLSEKVSIVGLKKLLNSSDYKYLISNRAFVHQLMNEVFESEYESYKSLQTLVSGFSLDSLENIKKTLNFFKLHLFASDVNIICAHYNGNYEFAFSPQEELIQASSLIKFINNEGIKAISTLGKPLGVEFLVIDLNTNFLNSKYKNYYLIFSIKKSFAIIKKIGLRVFNKNKPLFMFLLDEYYRKKYMSLDAYFGTMSKKAFKTQLQDEAVKYRYTNKTISVIAYTVDNFSVSNDDRKHHYSNDISRQIIGIISHDLKDGEIISSWGCGKFMILLPETSIQNAYLRAEDMRHKISVQHFDQVDGRVTISLGIASYPEHTKNIDDLVHKAEQALNLGHYTSRNKTTLWTEICDSYLLSDNINDSFSNYCFDETTNVIYLLEFIADSSKSKPYDERIKSFLNKVIDLCSVDSASLFLVVNDTEVKLKFSETLQKDDKVLFNDKLIKKGMDIHQSFFTVDWNSLTYDAFGVPMVKSIMILPIIYRDEFKGIAYLTANARDKEFTYNDLSFLSVLMQILAKDL